MYGKPYSWNPGAYGPLGATGMKRPGFMPQGVQGVLGNMTGTLGRTGGRGAPWAPRPLGRNDLNGKFLGNPYGAGVGGGAGGPTQFPGAGNGDQDPGIAPWMRWQTPGVANDTDISNMGVAGMRDLLFRGAFPGMLNQAGFVSNFLQPRFEQGIMDSLGMESATGARARADMFQKRSVSDALGIGDSNAATLAGAGYGSGTQTAARLDALNRANAMSFDAGRQILDPAARQARIMQLLGLGGQGLPSPMTGAILGYQEQYKPDKPTFLDQMIGIGGALGGLGLKLFS